MKRLTFTCITVLLSITVYAQFDRWFFDKTLRLDYIHSGDHETEYFFLDELKTEPYWAGSLKNLTDTFRFGHYFFELIDKAVDSVIYSRGYSTLFREWQTTGEAKNTRRAFNETVVMPLPKNNADIVIYSRDAKGVFAEKFRYTYKTDDYFVSPEPTAPYSYFDVHRSGDPHTNVDIVIIPEGYTYEEMGKFIGDCKKFASTLLSFTPYNEHSDKFNIRGILAPSEDSGSDIPADTVWKRTVANTRFYTFDSERYCMSYNNKKVRDLAANAPYDQIYILVNTGKYGGGAIYNYYSVSAAGNLSSEKIIVHEFGHGFAGLGDEYYTSDVAYNDFYPLDTEPWEPNLTTLVQFDRKWKQMVPDTVPIPTPDTAAYKNVTGVFEGGGYAAEGVYRPAHNCLMKSFSTDSFCAVCRKTITDMILFYSE